VTATPLPVRSDDHKGWAAHWGESALRALADYLSPAGTEAHLENVRRYSRQAWFRAARAKDYRYWEYGYLQAVNELKDGQL
jgi:hypothetical protein